MRANLNRKSLVAGIGAAGVLGLGLYLAVPAFADDPSPSPKPTASQHHKRDGHHGRQHGKQHPWRHQARFAHRGVHGEATVQRKDKSFHVSAWQRGQVTGVSGATVTVRSADGVSWTWTTNDKTRVRKSGDKSTPSALASGDQLVVLGERTGTTRTATRIVVPKKR
jgi:hypothetical protein